MGLKINKVLGYGLLDVKSNGYNVDDDRFLFQSMPEHLYSIDEREFLNWFMQNQEECISVLASFNRTKEDTVCNGFALRWMNRDIKDGFKKPEHHTPLTYDGDYGLPNVMVFNAMEYKDWIRRDDTIDYYESGCSPQNNAYVLPNSCGIYPHLGMYPKCGVSIPADVSMTYPISPSLYNQLTGEWDNKQSPLAEGKMLEHFLNDYRPDIPDSIILMAYRYGFLNDWKRTLCELRPMIYIYWN